MAYVNQKPRPRTVPNASLHALTLSSMTSAPFVHTKGGILVVLVDVLAIASLSSATLLKAPPLSSCFDLAEESSTAFNQEDDVG